MLEKFIKSYSGTYQYPTMVRHKGVVIAFAMDANRRIWYSILELGGNNPSEETNQEPKSPLDVDAWQAAPTELIFPNEIAEVGFGVADQTLLPVFKKNSTLPEAVGTILPPGKENEFDYFRSTTAQFTAKAPFQVLSDGRYVYVFRQAISENDTGSMVYVDDSGHTLTIKDGTKGYVEYNQITKKNEWVDTVKDKDGKLIPIQAAPLVNATLLVDRFLLTGTRLTPKMEVRYQRSRSKTRPATRKDSLGAKDLDDNFFYEPTQELRFIGNLPDGQTDGQTNEQKGGRFSVLLLPTAIAEIQRWQIFAENSETGRMDSYNVERSEDGLFNTRGSQTYTCVDHPQIYARRGGACSECGKTLIPRIVTKGYSESALRFSATSDSVKFTDNNSLNSLDFEDEITVEAWIKPDKPTQQACFVSKDDKGSLLDYSLGINAEGELSFAATVDGKLLEVTSSFAMLAGTWYHIAGTFDENAVRIFVNGNEDGEKEVKGKLSKTAKNLAFARSSGDKASPFAGTIDEVRLWKRARSESELQADMYQRLTGLESDLVGYWRFDEGSGGVAHDQSNNKLDGTINGSEWVISDAPVGEHPGIERTSFRIEGRTYESPPSSLLYYQQSKASGGYSGEEKYVKNIGRVMLAVATNDGDPENAGKNHIAALDFGVSPSGRLTQVPDEISLKPITPAAGVANQSLNEQLERKSNLQAQARLLAEDVSYKDKVIEKIDNALVSPATIEPDITDSALSGINELLRDYKKASADATEATNEVRRLNREHNNARVRLFQNITFEGRTMILVPDDINLGENPSGASASMTISSIGSIKVIGPVEIQVIRKRGGNRTFNADVPIIVSTSIDDWSKGNISNLRVFETQKHKNERLSAERKSDEANVKLTDIGNELTTARNTLQAERDEIAIQRTNVQTELDKLQSLLSHGPSAEMSRVHTDSSGLTVSGGVLGFAWSEDAPLLFDSATGTLALYFRGGDDQFFVTYYNTFTKRGSIPLPSKGGDSLTCFSTSTAYDKLKVVIEGADGDPTCTVKAFVGESEDDFSVKETWKKVPRAIAEFSKVLNGQATGHNYIGSGRKNKNLDGELILSALGARRAMNPGTNLMVGEERIEVKEQVFPGNKSIQFTGKITSTEELPVFYIEYDYAENATCEGISTDLSNGSILIRAFPSGDADTEIINTDKLIEIVPQLVCRWTAAAPGSTIELDGETEYLEAKDSSKLNEFATTRDLTLEAWVRPSQVDDKSSVIQHRFNDAQYMLALEKRDLQSAMKFDGNTRITVSAENSGFTLDGTFTVEAWVKPGDPTAVLGVIGGRSGEDNFRFDFKFQDNNRIHGDIGDGEAWLTTSADAEFDYVDGVWYHIAYVVTPSDYKIFIDGIEKGSGEIDGTPELYNGDHKLFIGATGDEAMQGAIDEVRIWKRARSQQEIQVDMNRRLSGNETDLVGYWHFENKQAKDYSRYQNNGIISGNSELDVSPLPAYTAVTGVSEKFVKARQVIPAGDWTHLAAAYHQAYGLEFDGGDYLDCGNDDTLDINQDITIEVFLNYKAALWPQLLLQRGILNDNDANQYMPYSLSLGSSITGSRPISFSFEDVDGIQHSYTATGSLNPNNFYKLAVTRKRESEQKDKGTKEAPDVQVTAWDKITFYVDGEISGSSKYESDQPDSDKTRQPVDIGNSNKPLKIGQAFTGIITEVRIWNLARKQVDIGKEITGNEKGLVSWWRFQEGKGNKAFDSKSKNHATINGAEWVKSPDPQGSSLKLYLNGQPQATDTLLDKATDVWKVATDQFTLGARKSGKDYDRYLQGELEEVRVWGTTRTEEQIQDNLFHRILGEKEELIAYYTFDAEAENQVSDYSLRGSHLKLSGGVARVLSTAPVGEDTPQVRSALAGIRTPFSGKLGSVPAVQEYADMQQDSQGNLIGIFKRCYSYVQDGKWQIITGYKVGDMVTEWIGQVQFAPQLIGFIEGAPPVPSENLTAHSADGSGDVGDYNEASVIELVEADETTNVYASSRDTGFDMDVNARLGFMVGTEASAGFGLVVKSVDVENIVGLQTRFEHSLGWLEDASTTISRSMGKSTSLALRGHIGFDENADPEFRNRFIPDNLGLALVKSETADVFALRLKHNGALISFQMRPNPDIPKDWNIIHFPINPRYTKQGTLDGKFGLEPDVDYPNALNYSPDSSYFKPIEAYALKDRINRAETQLRTYFEQYAAGEIGRRQAAVHFTEEDLAAGRILEKLPHLYKHNLINTYVWTADGGLFAETQETMDSQQEVIGGSYAFKGMAGFYTDLTLALFSTGAKFEGEAMFGGHLNLSVTKTQESSSSFGMNVSLANIERDIYQRDQDGEIDLDTSDQKRPMPIKQPGKVDAYRFMSFYLEPLSEHFEDFFNLVVDPIWIEQSDDPAAEALRGARNDNKEKKPAPWRIMHRVTYVSRVLPPLDDSAPPTLEKTLQTLDIDSNYELIKQLDPYVRDHLTDSSEFSDEVDKALKKYLPELISHKKEIKQYLSLYYGIDEIMPAPGAEGIGKEPEIEPVRNRPPTVKVGRYPEALELSGPSVTWTPDTKKTTVKDDRLEKPEDLFLKWEFLPVVGQNEEAVGFDNIHILKTTASFMEKGQYRLRLTASDGILKASDETVLVVNQAPVIESLTAEEPKPIEGSDTDFTVKLKCTIRTGLGDSSSYDTNLNLAWSVVSGSKEHVAGLEADETLVQDEHDPNVVTASKTITIKNRGFYLLKCTVNNGSFSHDSEINLEIAARVTDGLQALYTFEAKDGTSVYDVSGSDTPLNLVVSDPTSISWLDGGLALRSPGILSGAAKRLTAAIRSSNALTIEAWIKPAELDTPGLRRILTLSNGPAARNFILAQSGNTYHVGLRTSDDAVSDLNASLKSLVGGVTDIDRLAHVVFTRDAEGNAQLYVDLEPKLEGDTQVADAEPVSEEDTQVVDAEPVSKKNTKLSDAEPVSDRTVNGDFSKWDENFQLALGNEFDSEGRSDRAWLGEYHLLAIYDRALSEEEIKQNFDFGADRNLPPQVTAGKDMEINWSIPAIKDGEKWLTDGVSIDDKGRLTLDLHGVVRHDRPTTGSIEWSHVSDHPSVDFDDASEPGTKARFPSSGDYKLRLTATDDIDQVVSKEIMISITHETPVVKIDITDKNLIVTPDHVNTVTLDGAQADLALGGTIENSLGGAYQQDKLTFTWVSEPKNNFIEGTNQLITKAIFDKNGIYKLTLTATNTDNKELTASDSVYITVNQPPVVDAGPDQTLLLFVGDPSITTQLDGTVSDDGLPEPPGVLRLKWSVLSGDENDVNIMSDEKDFTEVQFKREGDYTLKLEADDSAVKKSDMVKITVKNNGMLPDGGRKAKVVTKGLHVRQDHDADNNKNILYFLKKDDEVTVIDLWPNPETNAIWGRLKPTKKRDQDPQWSAMKVGEDTYLEFIE